MAYPNNSRNGLSNYGPSSVSTPSPLRNSSHVSSHTAAYLRNATLESPTPSGALRASPGPGGHYGSVGHKRGMSEVVRSPARDFFEKKELASPGRQDSLRSALRPLPQAPNGPLPSAHARSQSFDVTFAGDDTASPPSKMRPHSLAISRSDSVRAPAHDRPARPTSQHVHFSPQALDPPDLEGLQKSSTSQLRALSKYAENGGQDDFTIKSKEQEVAGLHGRRRLQRTARDKKDPSMSKFASGWQSSKWMDQQRQFLQAYEYLCHIGEAKEWIEDIIQKQIPPIVQLEEALRDGVTLAEVVQALYPERPTRIFRHQKLQFRHSDNIALFFRFLAEVDLPELFRFELVDLYEKKNIPKVIYCIHALSWLLFRLGIVDFRIGNLVGQLQFEDHELEAMQKGLDKAGISMPNFSGMSANFGAEPEPEPEETEEERIERELADHESAVVDLQAQMRGALIRIHLGDTMQDLWDAEERLIDLQAIIRGDFARQISQYRLDMRAFAIRLQSASRGYLARSRRRNKEQYWKDREEQVVTLQSLFRARKARAETQQIQSRIRRHDQGIRNLQSAIRGALARWSVGDQYHETRQAEAGVQELQAAIRGAMVRRVAEQQISDTRQASKHIAGLQSSIRGMLQRQAQSKIVSSLVKQTRIIAALQGSGRAFLARQKVADTLEALDAGHSLWTRLQSKTRASAVRSSVQHTKHGLKAHGPQIVALQSMIRGLKARTAHQSTKVALSEQHGSVKLAQASLRGFVLRHKQQLDLDALNASSDAIIDLQALTRAFTQRQQTFNLLCQMNEHEDRLVEFQSIIRALMLQRDIGNLLAELESEEDAVVALQAAIRAQSVRQKFAEKQRFYKQNMEKVIKIQSFVRGRQQGEAYKSLTSGKNPPVGTVKNFVHLLNDSDFDFDEELGKTSLSPKPK